MAQLWGGIDMEMIAANFVNTGMLLFGVGAFSLMLALQQTSFMATLVRAYIFPVAFFAPWACPLMCCMRSAIPLLAPIGDGPHSYTWMWIAAAALTTVYIGLTIGFLHSATRLLERSRQENTPRIQIEPGIGGKRNRFWRWPALPVSVVAWKECYLDRSVLHILPYALLPFLFCLLVAHMLVWGADAQSQLVSESEVLSGTVMLACVGIYILMVAVRLTGSIVRERQQRTLETLLTLPIAPRAFLYQKLVGNLQRHWTWLLPAGGAWLMLLLFGEGRLAVGLVLPIVLAVHLAFFAMLGLFLSVVCKSALSAHVSLGLILALLLFGVPLFLSFADFPQARGLQRGLNPVHCWITIASAWWRPLPAAAAVEIAPAAVEIIAGVTLYAAAALMLWEIACRRFVRDPIGA